MSITPPIAPVPEPVRAPLPPERRTLVALLAALEGLLLVAASVVASLSRPQNVGPFCVRSPSGVSCGPGPTDPTDHVTLLVAAFCAVVALLVLPPVLGALSRRWQTALAAPSLPVWLALLAGVAFTIVTQFENLNSVSSPGGGYGDLFYAGAVVVNVAGPLLIVLFLVSALGGLGWLARRAFAR